MKDRSKIKRFSKVSLGLILLLVVYYGIRWPPMRVFLLRTPANSEDCVSLFESMTLSKPLKCSGWVNRWSGQWVGDQTFYYGNSDVIAMILSFDLNGKVFRRVCWTPLGELLEVSDLPLNGEWVPSKSFNSFSDLGIQTKDCRRAPLWDADLRGISLDRANFRESVLRHSNFDHSQLCHSSFVAAQIYDTTFQGANLEGADFYGSNLVKVDFSDANLVQANFTGVSLTCSLFQGAQLEGASFRFASFNGVDLRGVDLSKVKDLTFRQLQNASHWDLVTENNPTQFPKLLERQLRETGQLIKITTYADRTRRTKKKQ